MAESSQLSIILPMSPAVDRDSQFRQMRETAREIFLFALAEASIGKAFARQVHSERGVLRVCEDLYHVSAYARVFVVSLGRWIAYAPT